MISGIRQRMQRTRTARPDERKRHPTLHLARHWSACDFFLDRFKYYSLDARAPLLRTGLQEFDRRPHVQYCPMVRHGFGGLPLTEWPALPANLCPISGRIEPPCLGNDFWATVGEPVEVRVVAFGSVRRNISRTWWAPKSASITPSRPVRSGATGVLGWGARCRFRRAVRCPAQAVEELPSNRCGMSL